MSYPKYDSKTGTFDGVKGVAHRSGYLRVCCNNTQYSAHRLAWFLSHGKWPEHQIDHINGIRTDNRLCNLREATNQQNTQNRHKPNANNKSGYLGVCQQRNGLFRAKINDIVLGYYNTAEEASEIYLKVKRLLHEHNTL